MTADGTAREAGSPAGDGWSPWRVVVGFGVVSLAADMVYEGARSVYGPLLASLGASALVVGAVTGAGEAVALVLRLVSGPWADRTRRYWTLTIAGYATTAVCVPLLAVAPMLGGAGLVVAGSLILMERAGKAVRSPAKSALLADAAGQVGMGRGLGVHKALDQVGAFAGPLLVAGLISVSGGDLRLALAVLAVPGAVAMALLLLTRRQSPGPPPDPPPVADAGTTTGVAVERAPLPPAFWRFAVAASLCTAGLVGFGLIGFNAADQDLLPLAAVPVLYAGAMAAGAVAALATGEAYDRVGARVLLVLPLLVAAVPPLALGGSLGLVVPGALLWGAAVGVQDSTVKAMVADLVPRGRRATAYGLFAAVQGAGALVAGVTAGALYQRHLGALVAVTAVGQAVAFVLLVRTIATARGRPA
ncbi:MAG: MFS transporter [Mycobacteriales bacterium]|nr:MFS transporter [Mycobacteriales bacterium]